MKTAVHFSSATDDWSTPQAFFDRLNSIFDFTLDPCATDANHKTEQYFTEKDDGLAQSWDSQRTFINPPYGREIGKWVKKASEQVGGIAVCLLPARTDTKWWHDFVVGGGCKYMFLKGSAKVWRSAKQCAVSIGSGNILWSQNQ